MAEILYTVAPDLHRMARVEGGEVVELDFEIPDLRPSDINSIYLGQVVEIQKPLQAAFVDIGLSKPGIIPLKEGQLSPLVQGETILVQIIRTENPLEEKGPRLTRLISLSLGPVLYTPFKSGLNFSKKCKHPEEIQNQISLFPHEGVVVRSWAAPEDPYGNIIHQLRQEWEQIKADAQGKTPKIIAGPFDLLSRTLRSIGEKDKLYTDNKRIANSISTAKYLGQEPAFDERCEDAWDSLLSPKISVPRSGNLYIEETHALVAIDVNSQGDMRHAIPFNRRMVREILRQLRLRDLGGKIVVDLIHPPQSWKRLFEGIDIRSDLQIMGISSMGLLEMIRQKRRLSLPQRLQYKIN